MIEIGANLSVTIIITVVAVAVVLNTWVKSRS